MVDFEFMRDNWPFIAAGIGETLGIAILAFLAAIPLAMSVAAGRRSALLPVKALSAFYVWLMDGIPLLLEIFFIFLALPQLGIVLPGFWSAVVVLALHYGSRMSAVFRAPLAAAGISQGGTRVSLIPSLANELTGVIKDSTLISITGFLHDVMWRATKVGRSGFHMLEAFIIAAAIYLILSTIVSLGGKALSSTMPTAKSGPASSI